MSTAYVGRNGFPFSHTLIHSQQRLSLFVGVGFGFWLLSQPPPPSTQTIKAKKKRKKEKRGMKRPIHWLTTDPWPSFEILCLQIKLSGFKEQEVPQSCPGPLSVTGQLWGVNAHFSQLSRTCDGGKGKQAFRGHHTHKYHRAVQHLIGL